MPKLNPYSTLLIIFFTLMISLSAHGRELASFSFLLTAWIVIEGLRGRSSWVSMGFQKENFWEELKRNAVWIGLVGIGFQTLFWFSARFVYLPLWDQTRERLAGMQAWIPSLILLLVFITMETLLEEIAFRGFIQNRLKAHIGVFPAIIAGALLHTGFHWQVHINTAATLLDLSFVFVDNLVYGWIFARSQNIFVAWIAHLFADLVSLGLLLS